ncbi:HNH endonuclease family protein [Mycolicibacterium sp. 050158]|uniref:HNH endonuclease family protein n=1 Tax=Mycolicibacterium sp. 050158 TaxID=3090602 RepID=UPI00299DDEC5|nr:HNH endonuclease family protein [Mycolicibacterium sp. 050158]MDX1893278.1 HNH endonuclease family protein [Mycolicibacterium sp. 050158]
MLGAKVLLPALLSGRAVLADEAPKENLRALASALTTLFVRHTVIGGRESTTLESTVYSVAAELREGKDFDAAISALQSFAPDADDFVARFARASVSRTATARYLLREIEHAKRVTQEVAVELGDRVHVEHIYPQTPEEGARWSNHAQMVNRLGNLTLLGKRINTSLKNADFETKKKLGYSSSEILLTKDLLAQNIWSADAVEQRQKELAKLVFDIWKFPGEASPTTAQTAELADSISKDENDAQVLDELPEVPA